MVQPPISGIDARKNVSPTFCEHTHHHVRDKYFWEICRQMDLRREFDCFADTNQKFANVAKTREDVLKALHDPNTTTWINFSWNIGSQVSEAILSGQAACIVLCPAWSKPWGKIIECSYLTGVFRKQPTIVCKLCARDPPRNMGITN